LLAKSLARQKAMQMVILAGGLATRLRPLTDAIPKSLVPINGKPFLHYQIERLKRHGITDIVLCIGYLGDRIKEFLGDGSRLGVMVRYSEEKDQLLGTAGAIKKAEPLLREEFLVMNGDSYLMLDHGKIMAYFQRFHKLGLMVVHKNFDRWDRSNVIIDGNLVKVYSKSRPHTGMVYIDEGLSILRKETLSAIPPGEVMALEEFYQGLIKKKELLAYETRQRFYEIGSPAGLVEFQALVISGGIPT